jgi:hypothetical protein
MSRGDQARIKGGQQGRQNVVFYQNTSYLTNANGTATNSQINFTSKIIDLKSTVRNPTTAWEFVSPRSRFYFVSFWVQFFGLPNGSGLLGGVEPATYPRVLNLAAKVNTVSVMGNLIGQEGRLVFSAQNNPDPATGGITPAYLDTLSNTSAHIEGAIFLNAGDSLTVEATYDFSPVRIFYTLAAAVDVNLNVDAKAYAQITEISPEQ